MKDIKISKKLNTLFNDERMIELLTDSKTVVRTPLIAAKKSPQSIVERLFLAITDPNITTWCLQRDGLQPVDKTQYWHDCQDTEQKKMQSDDPLLCEFLLETDEAKLVDYLSNPDVREELKKGQYKEKYPQYAYLIESQYNKGIKLWKMQELTTSLEGAGLTQVQPQRCEIL